MADAERNPNATDILKEFSSVFEPKEKPLPEPFSEAIGFYPSPLDPYREMLGLQTSIAYRLAKKPAPPAEGEPITSLFQALSALEDPAGAIGQLNAARYVAETFGLDPSETYANLDQLSEYWLGKVAPAPVFAQSVKDAWQNGTRTYDIGKLALDLRGAGGQDPAIMQKIAELEEAMVPLKDIPRPWIKNAILWAAESGPLMARSYLRGLTEAGIAGGAALGIGAVTGGISLPITLAVMQMTFSVGTAVDMAEVMQGLQYYDLIKKGVPHEVASPISVVSGIIQGGIEFVGQAALGFVPGVKGLGTRIANKMISAGVLTTFGVRVAGSLIGGAMGEAVEEPFQEWTQMLSEQIAMEASKNRGFETEIQPLTLGEFVDRTVGAIVPGFSAGLVFGLFPVPFGIRADISQLNTIKKLAVETADKRTFVNTAQDMVLKESHVSDRAWRDYLGRVWDKQHAQAKPVSAAAAQAAGKGEAAAEVGEEYREAGGRLHMVEKTRRRTKEGADIVLTAGNPKTGERYGYITYETGRNRVEIREVKSEIDTDIRREMILEVAARYPGSEIEWNPVEEEEIELRSSIIVDNPRGPERGLQWFSIEEAAAPGLTRALFTQRMAETFNLEKEEAEQFGAFADIFARNQGITVDEWLNRYIAPEVTREAKKVLQSAGGVAATGYYTEAGEPVMPLEVDREEVKGRVRAVFSAMETGDFHHAVHEFFHAVERLALSPEQIGLFEQAIGKLRPTWTEADLETLAQRFEDYLARGKAPTPELQTVFQKIAELLNKIVSYLRDIATRGRFTFSPEFLAAYDALFAKPESGVSQATTAEVDVAEQVEDEILVPEQAPPEPEPTVTVFETLEFIEPTEKAPPAEAVPAAEGAIPVDVREVSVAEVALSKEVPNFKEAASEKGIVERLEGTAYERLGTAPIVLWERTDGRLEVITGRHRLDLAQRLGEKTIPAQVVREADGFTAAQAMTFDAEANIRDGQGSVKDYANYFRHTEITDEEASRRGLLARDKGRKGFAIGKYAGDGLYTLYRNERINDTKAAAIASTVPNNEQLQDLGIAQAKELNADELVNYLEIMKDKAEGATVEQMDLFGKNESFMLEAKRLAQEAVKKMGELRAEYNALKGALRLSTGDRAKIVQKYGFETGDVLAVQERVAELEISIEEWTNWTTDSEKHTELRRRLGEGMLFHPEGLLANGVLLQEQQNPEGARIREAIENAKTRYIKLKRGDFSDEFIPQTKSAEERKQHLLENVERYLGNLRKVTDKGAKLEHPDGGPLWYYLHRSTRAEEENRWRMTTWDKRGAVGHHLAQRGVGDLVGQERAATVDVDDLISLLYEQSFAGYEIVETVGKPYAMLFHPAPTIDSPEFRRWFADSKVVDAEHKPLIVYHGTPTPGFSVFRRSQGGFGDATGFWFGSEPDIANEFARQRFVDQGPAIYPVYLSIKNPAVYDGWSDFVEACHATQKIDIREMQRSLRNNLIRKGHDGIIIRGSTTDQAGVRDDYVAFYSEQIKSVFNRGTWDSSVANMLFHRDTADQAQIIDKAIRFFGITRDPMEAGYILPDGRMLDLSGPYKGRRSLEHGAVFSPPSGENPFGLQTKGRHRIVEFQQRSGAVRYDADDGFASVVEASTRAQIRRMVDGWKISQIPKVYLDWINSQGISVAGRTIQFPTPAKVQAFFDQAHQESPWLFHPESDPWILKSAEIIRDKMQGKMPAVQIRQMLVNNGVKADEMKWVGLDDFLKGNKKLTPQDVLEYIRDNSPVLREKQFTGLRTFHHRWTLEGGEQYRELLLVLPQYRPDVGIWEHTHWPERNVIAHMRFDERQDVAGNPVLFIEEIQSDWHQAGREKGYGRRLPEIGEEFESPRRTGERRLVRLPLPANAEGLTRVIYVRNCYGSEYYLSKKEFAPGPPPAPFAKTWHELCFRRMLQWAVENGFEIMAWTTGKQQADRYNLSRHIEAIRLEGDFDQSIEVSFARPGESFQWATSTTRENLHDVVGDQIAAKALGEGQREFRGVDLEAGGEGMMTFYDQILVKYAKKYGKKWGGEVQKETITLPRPAQIQLQGTIYALRSFDEIFRQHGIDPHDLKVGMEIPGYGAIEDMWGDTEAETVHAITITPEMKASVQAGQYLFHYDPGFWPKRLIYGTPIGRGIWEQYVAEAKDYESAEAFEKAMLEQYGQLEEGDIAGQEKTDFFRQVWEEAHEEEPEEKKPPEIPTPELPEEPEYDYSDKAKSAQDITDTEKAGKMARGEITDEEVEELSAKNEEEISELEAQTEAAEGEATAEREKLSEAERLIISLGDKLEAAIDEAETMPSEERRKTLEAQMRTLHEQFRQALLENLDAAEDLLGEMIWKRAIIFGEQIGGEEAVTQVGESYEKAVALGRELQAAIDERKLKGEREKAKKRHAESRARIYAKKREQMKAFKAELQKKKKERRAIKKYKEAKRKLIADIMRPPGKSISYRGYAEVITMIQRGLDPINRQKKTRWRREQTRKFLIDNPEVAAAISPEELDKIYSVILPDLSLAQLEEIAEKLNLLRKMGRLKRSLQLEQRRRMREESKARMVTTVLRGEEPRKPVGRTKGTAKPLKTMLPTWKPDRVAQFLDGAFAGKQKDVFYHWLIEEPNRAWSEKVKMERQRMKPVLAKMKELKLTMDPLDPRRAKGFSYIGESLDIGGFRYDNGKAPTVNDAMFWYIGMGNERTAAALIHGNNLPENVILKGITMLTKEQRALADAIAQDFDANFPRLREAFIDTFNMDLPAESAYVPMRRLEISYETRSEEVAAELTGRAGVRKQFIARHPTYARIDIADEHQKPIRTDLMGLWIDGVKVQEGFIAEDQLIKNMHSILESDDVRAAVQQQYGPAMNKWLRKYINDLAQADAYQAMSGVEKFSRIARSNAAVSWLAFNLLPNLKQLTGLSNYLADAGPVHLALAAAQFVGGKGKSLAQGKFLNNALVDFVDERTELLLNRQISQELEDLKNLDYNLYARIVKKIGITGMYSLFLIDRTTVYIGWKAVYDRVMAKSGNEAQAIKAADESTIRTQPSHRVQDMAEMYRHGELLKWFTMFTSELSVTWNRLTFDVPVALRRRELLHALGDLTSFAIIGLGIAIASGGLAGDKDERKKKLIMGAFSQYFEAIPFFGNDLFAAVSGKYFGYGGVKIFPAIDYLTRLPAQIKAENYEDAAVNLLKGAAFGAGLPVSGPTKAAKAIKTKELRAILGWK